jgi:autotransporter-associated beta strand protein
MSISSFLTWDPTTNDYSDKNNWSPSLPPLFPSVTASFGTSPINNISLPANTVIDVGGWLFSSSAPHYVFSIGDNSSLRFYGEGIVIHGGSAEISLTSTDNIRFFNNSTAGDASITNDGGMQFFGLSTGGTTNITNNNIVFFLEFSSAAGARIETAAGAGISFGQFSTGGTAELITDPGGFVDFSFSTGPAGNGQLTVGSLAGGGSYYLGSDQLVVGLNGLSRTVSGAIDDGNHLGSGAGGGSLVKVGHDRLTLAGVANTYSGGTTIEQGTLELAAIGAAGPGPITFANVGKAKMTLQIDNAALSGHVFATNAIDNFGKHDFLDLTGLHFHAGATATYHKASHHLTVHSGHVTDTLTLLSPHGTHFAAASDHHGGTDAFLVFA